MVVGESTKHTKFCICGYLFNWPNVCVRPLFKDIKCDISALKCLKTMTPFFCFLMHSLFVICFHQCSNPEESVCHLSQGNITYIWAPVAATSRQKPDGRSRDKTGFCPSQWCFYFLATTVPLQHTLEEILCFYPTTFIWYI